jgi:hypothetical protein
MLCNPEFYAALPHAGLGSLLRSSTNERSGRRHFLEILEDCTRLREPCAVVELERGHLPYRVSVNVGRSAVLTSIDIDILHRNGDAFLQEKHADCPRVWSSGI